MPFLGGTGEFFGVFGDRTFLGTGEFSDIGNNSRTFLGTGEFFERERGCFVAAFKNAGYHDHHG